ncbi:hypothetical protein MYX84_12280 [Acidobacteria bacterium AH-259-O06]|nr:hypothetical protein [Acidobacteria bacterium AH-259-O06]
MAIVVFAIKVWKEHVLTRVVVPINSRPVDLDGDGDLDILGGSRYESRIFWFENLGQEEIRFRERRGAISTIGALLQPTIHFLPLIS